MKKVKKSKSFKIYLQKPLIRGFFRTFPQKRRRCVLYYYLFWLFLIKIKNRETVTMLLPIVHPTVAPIWPTQFDRHFAYKCLN